MVAADPFTTLQNFLLADVFGGSQIGYTLFAFGLIGVLFVFMMMTRIEPKLGLALIFPAIVGAFTQYVQLIWIVVIVMLAILIFLGLSVNKAYSGG